MIGAQAFAQSATCGALLGGWPSQLICFGANTPAVAADVNANFRTVWNAVLPVGSIIAWHKSLPNTPALPANFVECNGQLISDPESPYNGRSAPDLNAPGRFLRGAATSGVTQADALQLHRHELNSGQTIHLLNYVWPSGALELYGAAQRACTGAAGCTAGYSDDYTIASPVLSDPLTDGGVRTAGETRPANMSVVWVMRIK